MRSGFGAVRSVSIVLLAWGVAAACSAGGSSGPGKKGSGNNGSGASNGTGGTFNIAGTGGTTNIDPNNPDGGDPNPQLTPCIGTSDCFNGEVCVLKEGGGLCSPKGPACTADGNECVNDTYCCVPSDGCKIDGVTEPVCVSNGTRPVNNQCKKGATVGIFAPDLQCEWTKPEGSDGRPNSILVLTTPLVANLPTDSGTAAEIIIVTSEATAAGPGEAHIRILNGQTCKQIELIDHTAVNQAVTPAVADLDNDGDLEIVTRGGGKLIAFTFEGGKYKQMWASTASAPADAWDGVSIHDLNNDGVPEIIGRGGEVFDAAGGRIAAPNAAIILATEPVIADVDGDKTADLVANKVFSWNGKAWVEKYPGLNLTSGAPSFYGVADFGTRTGPGAFDHTKKDGRAEVIGVGTTKNDDTDGTVRIYTLEGEPVLKVDYGLGPSCLNSNPAVLGERGGPPTVGDFDGDGMPELAYAGAFGYRVFDLGCKDAGAKCQDAARSILWERETQDCSSGKTGSTIFDFEGDNRAEAVYADECFVRVYDGKTGEVLFSAPRNSATWYEQPIVADPDNSDRSKIIFSGAPAFSVHTFCQDARTARVCEQTPIAFQGCIDEQWAGVRCTADDECISQKCVEGFCRCTTNEECGTTIKGTDNDQISGIVCVPPKAGTPGSGNVCRSQFGATTNPNKWFAGIKVYRDKLDRWASSRPLWNQHAYSVTNINDDGKIPATGEWAQNFLEPDLNNFRQNRQGATSQELADITGALDGASACVLTADNQIKFTGRICNRGLRGIGSNMPAAFYLGENRDKVLCTTQTDGPVPVGGCKNIECLIPKTDIAGNSTISMIVNDAGGGSRLVDECDYENNMAQAVVEKCDVPK